MWPVLVARGVLAAGTGRGRCRDPLYQPFGTESIWNTPIGRNARFADVGLADFATGQFHADTNYVLPHDPSAPEVDIVDQGWWGPTPPATGMSSALA